MKGNVQGSQRTGISVGDGPWYIRRSSVAIPVEQTGKLAYRLPQGNPRDQDVPELPEGDPLFPAKPDGDN